MDEDTDVGECNQGENACGEHFEYILPPHLLTTVLTNGAVLCRVRFYDLQSPFCCIVLYEDGFYRQLLPYDLLLSL